MKEAKENKSSLAKREYRIGVICAVGCGVLWGILPVYWKLLSPIDAFVIIFYRIVMVAVFTCLLCLKLYGWQGIIGPLKQKGLKPRTFAAGLLVTANWSMYIWAVNANQLIETCIGYYMEPLMVCILGVILFKEKLTKPKTIALCLAGLGVAVLLVYFGKFPAIALFIAVTFAAYAAMKKTYQLPAILSLFYETMFLVPPALVAIVYCEASGQGVLVQGQPYQWALLALTGAVTAVPLSLFAMAINRVTLVVTGLAEYLSPSISLLIGVFLFKEPFYQVQFVSFFIIWIGLAFFTAGELREAGRHKAGEVQEV